MEKTKKIIIITIISILVLICGVFAYLFFLTDTFKPNKEMFYKYASQIDLKGFTDFDEIETLIKRFSKEPNTNEGNIIISKGNDIKEEIVFNIKNDPENKKTSGSFTFRQDDEDKINANYLRYKDVYGLQCIYKQYMVLKNNNLKELAKKMGIDSNQVPDKIELENTEINFNEDIEKIKSNAEQIENKYLKIITNEIPDKNYTRESNKKIEVDGKTLAVDGYTLTLNGNEMINIFNKCIESAKNDNDVFDLVNSVLAVSGNQEYTFEQYQKSIETIKESIGINESMVFSITMYKQGNKLVTAYVKITEEDNFIDITIQNDKITINSETNYFSGAGDTKNSTTITLKKNNADGQKGYDVQIGATQNGEEIIAEFSCILKNESEKAYKLGFYAKLEYSGDYDYGFEMAFADLVSFEDDLEMDSFKEGNYVILNDLSQEQLTKLFTNFGKELSKKVDLEKVYIPIVSDLIMANSVIMDSSQNAAQNAADNVNEQVVNIFNERFSMYAGEQSGTTVKSLITSVNNSNMRYEEHKIGLDIGIEEIDSSKKYIVSFGKDAEGFINKVNIKEK